MGTRWKCNPFRGSSHAKGIVVEKVAIEAKQVSLFDALFCYYDNPICVARF